MVFVYLGWFVLCCFVLCCTILQKKIQNTANPVFVENDTVLIVLHFIGCRTQPQKAKKQQKLERQRGR